MGFLVRFPFVGFGPQLALGAGLLAALISGLWPRVPAASSRAVGAIALVLALVLAALTLPGTGEGMLIRVDGIAIGWQYVFYLGALPFALLMRSDDEVSPALMLGSVLGMALLAASANLLMLFIGLEFLSLPAYLLVARAKGRNAGAQEAAVKYFFAGSTAGAMFLLGLSLHYAASRTLALAPGIGPLAEAGVALMGAAALFKVGCVPLHFWLPDVYESAAPEVSGFLSTSVKAAGILLLIRVTSLAPSSGFAQALPWLGAATALFGAILALRQTRLQRLLAYSSMAHAGNLILAVGAWAAQGMVPTAAASVYFYLFAYLFMNNGAFGFLRVTGLSERSELAGYAAKRPMLAALFAALLLSLGGIPPAAGFLAKLLVFWEAIKAGLYVPVALAGLAALISLGYYLGLVRDMYLDKPVVAEHVPACLFDRMVLTACAVPAALLGLLPWLPGVFARWLTP